MPTSAGPPGPPQLLRRLDAIATSVATREGALALIALGSAGPDRARLDAWSDLDLLLVVEPGCQRRFVEHTDWLAAAQRIDWQLRAGARALKVLMADGVLCDITVADLQELAGAAFAPGCLLWKRPDIDDAVARPRRPLPRPNSDEGWIVGSALAALLVGLRRWQRGEKLSALRLVQGQALERLIELDALRRHVAASDPFEVERHLEDRQPALAAELAALAAGYLHTPTAALALLDALQRRGATLAPPITQRIRELAAAAIAAPPAPAR